MGHSRNQGLYSSGSAIFGLSKMKSLIIAVSFAALVAVGCSSPEKTPVSNSNSPETVRSSSGAKPMNEHTLENQPAPMPSPTEANSDTGGAKSKWTASGDPIDTKKFDDAIAVAEKAVKQKPNDEAAKKQLAEAYFERAVALTEARQYASALGDYRHVNKLDPNSKESKEWIEKIEMIYGSLKKEAPKPGEEPKPLPYKQ